MIDGTGVWKELSQHGTTCATAVKISRAWLRTYYRHGDPRYPHGYVRVKGYRCRLQTLQGVDNPYGRVVCASGDARLRFYGAG